MRRSGVTWPQQSFHDLSETLSHALLKIISRAFTRLTESVGEHSATHLFRVGRNTFRSRSDFSFLEVAESNLFPSKTKCIFRRWSDGNDQNRWKLEKIICNPLVVLGIFDVRLASCGAATRQFDPKCEPGFANSAKRINSSVQLRHGRRLRSEPAVQCPGIPAKWRTSGD
jgi:hypothetical protein